MLFCIKRNIVINEGRLAVEMKRLCDERQLNNSLECQYLINLPQISVIVSFSENI